MNYMNVADINEIQNGIQNASRYEKKTYPLVNDDIQRAISILVLFLTDSIDVIALPVFDGQQ